MAKDGTNRGRRRVRAGAKPGPLGEKLAAGRPATRLEDPLNEPFDFAGNDIGDGAVLAGETMPEPSDYLSEIQRDGKPLGADLVYRETWQWLDQRGGSQFVAPRLIEAYAQAFARYVQCEQAISKFGLLGKHPTTGAAIASPFVAMSQSFGKAGECVLVRDLRDRARHLHHRLRGHHARRRGDGAAAQRPLLTAPHDLRVHPLVGWTLSCSPPIRGSECAYVFDSVLPSLCVLVIRTSWPIRSPTRSSTTSSTTTRPHGWRWR